MGVGIQQRNKEGIFPTRSGSEVNERTIQQTTELEYNQDTLARYGLDEPQYTATLAPLLVQAGTHVSSNKEKGKNEPSYLANKVARLVEDGDYRPAVDSIMNEAQQLLTRATTAAGRAQSVDQQRGLKRLTRSSKKEWQYASGKFANANMLLQAARTLIEQLPAAEQREYLAQITHTLENDHVWEIANRLPHHKVKELTRKRLLDMNLDFESIEEGEPLEYEMGSLSRAGAAGWGTALGAYIYGLSPIVMIASAPTSGLIWNKWARYHVNKSRNPEEFERRFEKYKKAKRSIRNFAIGAVSLSTAKALSSAILK